MNKMFNLHHVSGAEREWRGIGRSRNGERMSQN